jgi:hypothetical protein
MPFGFIHFGFLYVSDLLIFDIGKSCRNLL